MSEKWTSSGEKKIHIQNSRSKFDIGMPDRWLAHAREGGSIPQFCRKEGIAKTTFKEYCEKYPEMGRARTLGKDMAEGWWIDQAQAHLITHSSKDEGTTKFDTSLYKWITAGRFGHSEDSKQREILDELMRRTAHLAQSIGNPISEEAECEPNDNTSE